MITGFHSFAIPLRCNAVLLLTSAPVVDGRRRIFHEDNRLRLADGCVLIGRSLDRVELARIVSDGLPFVSVGRRDDAGGPVPYVGADYPAGVSELVRRAVALGHVRLAYLGQGAGPESHADRMRGFAAAVKETGIKGRHETVAGRDVQEIFDSIRKAGVTAVFAEEHADAVALAVIAENNGLSVPDDLSVLALGDPTRVEKPTAVEFTGFRIPRQQMGREALDVLSALIEGTPTRTQRLLPCTLVPGATLAPAPRRARTNKSAHAST